MKYVAYLASLKIIILLLLFQALAFEISGQNKWQVYQDSINKIYPNFPWRGTWDPKEATYDSFTNKWYIYNIYKGNILRFLIYHGNGIWRVDSSIVYYYNGNIAYILSYGQYHDSFTAHHGRFSSFYESGTKNRVSYYYFGVKSGIWKEFYENGKLKSHTEYLLSSQDSLIAKDWELMKNYKENIKLDSFETEGYSYMFAILDLGQTGREFLFNERGKAIKFNYWENGKITKSISKRRVVKNLYLSRFKK